MEIIIFGLLFWMSVGGVVAVVQLQKRLTEIKTLGKLTNAGYTLQYFASRHDSGHWWEAKKNGHTYSLEDALKREEMIRLNIIEVAGVKNLTY